MKRLTKSRRTALGICASLIVALTAMHAPVFAAETTFKVGRGEDGKFWFTAPDGDSFLSLGVNHIEYTHHGNPTEPKYDPIPAVFEDAEAWADGSIELLKTHNFNTVGCWSNAMLDGRGLMATPILYAVGHEGDRVLDGLRPGLEERVLENARAALEPYGDRADVLGVFIDNEMPWYGKVPWVYEPTYTLLELALAQPDDDAARQKAAEFLTAKYETTDALNEAWGTDVKDWNALNDEALQGAYTDASQADRDEFIAMAADAFFSRVTAALREAYPDLLILGTRFAFNAPDGVIEACGRYCDVVSFNYYRAEPVMLPEHIARMWVLGGKPLLLTEYSWRAEENSSGNPNTQGAPCDVKTQTDRARNYRLFLEDLLSHPMVVGAHWFEFADEPPNGRFDGENSNYGIVDIYHRPYEKLLTSMKETNARAAEIHRNGDDPYPTELPEPKKVEFEASHRPDRPPVMELLDLTNPPEISWGAPDAQIDLNAKDDDLLVKFNSGADWGCGLTIAGPDAVRIERNGLWVSDFEGYSALEIEASVPEGVVFNVYMEEAGVAAPGSGDYDARGGDDGESFRFVPSRGSGERTVYRYEFDNLLPRTEWGNQNGRRRIDMASMLGIALHINGGQGEKELTLHRVRLMR